MSQSVEAKLHELRRKTNRQLTSLISNKLDRGLASVRVTEGEHCRYAERAFLEASAWMALLRGTTKLERRSLEFKLAQLRAALERTRASRVRVQAAC